MALSQRKRRSPSCCSSCFSFWNDCKYSALAESRWQHCKDISSSIQFFDCLPLLSLKIKIQGTQFFNQEIHLKYNIFKTYLHCIRFASGYFTQSWHDATLTLVAKPRPSSSTRESLYKISQNPKRYLVRNLAKSETISRTKSRKIPNDISYEISWALAPTWIYDYAWGTKSHTRSRKLNNTRNETRRDETRRNDILEIFFFPTTVFWDPDKFWIP